MLCLVVAGGLNTLNALETLAISSLRDTLRQTSETLSFAVVPYAAEGNLETLQVYLDHLVNLDGHGIVYLALLDDSGQVLLQTATTPQPLPTPLTTPNDYTFSQTLAHIAVPLLLSHNRVGSLRYGFSSSWFNETQRRVVRDHLLPLSLALSAVTLASVLVGRRFNRRLTRLVRLSQALASGDFAERIPEQGSEEFIRLARHFNGMADAVAERTQALRIQGLELERAQAIAQVGSWHFDMQKQCYRFSPEAMRILRLPANQTQLDYQAFLDAIHPDDRERVQAKQQVALQGGGGCDMEFRIRAGEKERLFHSRGLIEWGSEGQPLFATGVLQDITDRRAAERQMQLDREQQDILQRLLEIVVLESNETALTLQRFLNHLLTLPWLSQPGQGGIFLLGAGNRLWMQAAHLPAETEMLCAHVPLGCCHCGLTAVSGELRYVARVGDSDNACGCPGLADYAYYGLPLHSEQGVRGVLMLYLPAYTPRDAAREGFLMSAAGVLAAYLSRKQAERALLDHQAYLEVRVKVRTAELAASETRSRIVLQTLLDGVVQIDTQGKILSANSAVSDLFGYSEAELVGQSVNLLMPEPYRSQHDIYLKRYFETRQSVIIGQRREVMGLHKRGDTFPVEISVIELHIDEEHHSFIGVLRDISQRKETERQLTAAAAEAERLARLKSEFLANMSHEIRTPLNAVLGFAQIGQRDSTDIKETQHFQHILDAGQHLLGVVNDILDFSKIEAGKLALDRQTFNLYELTTKTVDMLREPASRKHLALNHVMAPGVPEWLESDPLRIGQILTNLLSNAVKFTQQGGILLSVLIEGHSIVFHVSDTGIGLSDEQKSRLFNAFEQADGSITRQYGGTGLGLAISRRLARLMGGDLVVESHVDAGSVFSLILPLTPGTALNAPTRLTVPAPPLDVQAHRLEGIRILAAEDVEMNRLILEDLLLHEGASVTFAENGQHVLDYLAASGPTTFDIVLMDIQMPVMDGREAAWRLRSLAPRLPIIGLTAHAMSEERERCLAVGMVDYVTKPIDIDHLVVAILRALRAVPPLEVTPPMPLSDTTVVAQISATSPRASVPAELPATMPTGAQQTDWSALLNRYQGRHDFIAKLLKAAAANNAETAEKLRAAIAAQNWDQLVFMAHTLKGSAGNLDAPQLRECAKRTEDAIRANDHPQRSLQYAAELADLVQTWLHEIRDALENGLPKI